MEIQNIDKLLQKYWNCETTLQEEQLLQEFFMQDNVSESYNDASSLFNFTHKKQAEKLGANFDEKLMSAINNRQKRHITIKLFAPTLKVAAMIAFIFVVGLSGVIWINSTKKQNFSETYSDSYAAYKEATSALDQLSIALQKGEALSLETLVQINQLEVDWNKIDSINNTLYNNNSEEDNEEQITF